MKKTAMIFLSLILPILIVFTLFRIQPLLGIAAVLFILFFGTRRLRPMIYTYLGGVKYNQNQIEESLDYLEKAYRTGRASTNSAVSYGYLLLKTGRLDEGEEVFQKLSESPLSRKDKIDVNLNVALVLWKRGKQEEAVQLLYDVREEVKNTVLYGNLGYMLLLKGDVEEALAINLEAYEYNDTNTAILDNLGLTYFVMGEMDKAEELYEKLMPLSPKFPEAYYNYGVLLEQKGETDKAVEMYRKSLEYPRSLLCPVSVEETEERIQKLVNG